MKKNLLRLGVGIGLSVLVALGVGLAFLATPAALLPEAEAALATTADVTYAEVNGWLVFAPTGAQPATGLIFYPGGRVPAPAYAPAAAAIAAAGFRVVIPPMPLNLAVLDIDVAAAIQAAFPEVTRWAIAGHSLGGSMAAEYAARHPGAVQGLVFWASYSATDLTSQPVRVVSVYGALESGRASFISAEARARLPGDVRFVEIAGGNHEQFGYYTGQPNDPAAQTPRATQQAEAVAATVALLEALAAP